MRKKTLHNIRQAFPKAIARVRRATTAALRGGREFARRHPELVAGALAGYSLGALAERVPGVRLLLGPLPRIAGLAAGAFLGHCFQQALREVQTEKSLGARECACL